MVPILIQFIFKKYFSSKLFLLAENVKFCLKIQVNFAWRVISQPRPVQSDWSRLAFLSIRNKVKDFLMVWEIRDPAIVLDYSFCQEFQLRNLPYYYVCTWSMWWLCIVSGKDNLFWYKLCYWHDLDLLNWRSTQNTFKPIVWHFFHQNMLNISDFRKVINFS